ncbi:CBO0543 family protein [Cytobacillus sp. NCCP-133]|uniref:CBO0543 family protein n=1 Tax=Cytobacillus sp. NCCP-133 TaxID=766848 RepID=UPI0028528E29|nr:CBO0543 family protein [Cytobacillus sp. NCCP-133]
MSLLHYLLVLFVIILAFKKGDWKNWENYYPTMLYVSLSSFVYEFISHSHFHLWELEKKLLNLMGVHFLHNLIINPLLGFVFLSRYPSNSKSRFFYCAKWIVLFLAAEWIAHRIGIITYYNGWNIGWSLLFVLIMFPMIRLHYLHKRIALLLSVVIATIYLFLFDYL